LDISVLADEKSGPCPWFSCIAVLLVQTEERQDREHYDDEAD
jgi:hypothetical protein